MLNTKIYFEQVLAAGYKLDSYMGAYGLEFVMFPMNTNIGCLNFMQGMKYEPAVNDEIVPTEPEPPKKTNQEIAQIIQFTRRT